MQSVLAEFQLDLSDVEPVLLQHVPDSDEGWRRIARVTLVNKELQRRGYAPLLPSFVQSALPATLSPEEYAVVGGPCEGLLGLSLSPTIFASLQQASQKPRIAKMDSERREAYLRQRLHIMARRHLRRRLQQQLKRYKQLGTDASTECCYK